MIVSDHKEWLRVCGKEWEKLQSEFRLDAEGTHRVHKLIGSRVLVIRIEAFGDTKFGAGQQAQLTHDATFKIKRLRIFTSSRMISVDPLLVIF
jgi:hypothetical protein